MEQDYYSRPLGGWEADIHNPNWDKVREAGLNMKEAGYTARRRLPPENCERCGKKDTFLSPSLKSNELTYLCNACYLTELGYTQDGDAWVKP